MRTTFIERQRRSAAAWKAVTASLPDDARGAAPYIDKDGRKSSVSYSFCLPAEYARLNVLPEVREQALTLFGALGVPWHAGVDGGPSNHLLSSQVQCVNALAQMVGDAERARRAFAPFLGTEEVLEIEPGRHLTFEFIGPSDYFGEAPGGKRVRGAHCTSVDAAFVQRTTGGMTELVLVEWKYTESYRRRLPEPGKDAIRRARYWEALAAPDSPVRADLLPFEALCDEPFYQLMRQQLLAWELERDRVLGAERVRVVHIAPAANESYQSSLHRPEQLALGSTVAEVWSKLLRASDRFLPLDSTVFLDPAITSGEYAARYTDEKVGV